MLAPPRGLSRPAFKRWYRDVYLQSDHWLVTREHALERSGRECQSCSSKRRLQVHHLSYERIGREEPEDLVVLCRPCHDRLETARIERRLESRRAEIGDDREDAASELEEMSLAELLADEEDPVAWWRQQVADWPDNVA
jgi:hypothetical protein